MESIEVVRLEVFEERDKVPMLLNWLHTTTRENIIEREVLLTRGQPYRQTLADETERNLQGFAQLSVVLVVPLEGSRPDSVRVLVITKDVWSLRVSWEPSFYNGRLTGLTLQPSEWNIAGTTQRASGTLILTGRNYWLGGTYFIPRIGGSRLQTYVSGNAVFNCRTDQLEGATGYFEYGEPLFTTRQRWSWRTAASWSSLVQQPVEEYGQAICADSNVPRIRTTGLEVLERTRAEAIGDSGNEFAGTNELRRDLILPYRYREERLRGQFVLTRSFFRVDKLNLSTGIEADQLRLDDVEPRRDQLQGVDTVWQVEPFERLSRNVESFGPDDPRMTDDLVERGRSAFRSRLALNSARGPTPHADLILGDRRISPYIQLHAFRSSYLNTIHLQTSSLQEYVQVGHDTYLRLYPALRPLSSRSLLGVHASAAYTWPLGSGFFRAATASLVEIAASGNEETHQPISGAEQSDAQTHAGMYFASPLFRFGRFVSGASLLHTPVRFLKRFGYGLGGTDRLRGYEPSAFIGVGRFVLNNELRVVPLRIYSVAVGLNLFYDVGDARNRLEDLDLKHGAGFGLRFLFPQLDRDVFRIDFGFPLQEHDRGEFTLVAGFGQVFGTPGIAPAALLPQ